jgi:hypothetical protein
MGNRFASGKWAIAQCDRCDGRFKLKQLRKEIIKTKNYELLVCPECWDPDQPQLQLGMFPVDDPQGLRNPRPDRSYLISGLSGLQIVNSTSTDTDAQGTVEGGSRIFQWGWNPVGGAAAWDAGLTPNNLVLNIQLGNATVELDMMPGAMLSGVSSTGSVGNALGPLPITGVQTATSAGQISGPGLALTGVSSTPAIGGVVQHKNVVVPGVGVYFYVLSVPYNPDIFEIRVPTGSPVQNAAALALQQALDDSPAAQFVQLFIDAETTNPPSPTAPFFNFGMVMGTALIPGYASLSTYLPGTPHPAPGTYYVNSAFKSVQQFSIPAEYGTPAYSQVGPNSTLTYSGLNTSTLNSTYLNCPVLPVGTNVWAYTSSYSQTLHLGTLTSIVYDAGAQTFKINMVTDTPFTGGLLEPLWFVPNTINI